ncbi:hypothetical protein EVA_17386 [gut metagenome]|uniref:Uncharacterized protein n=1 Tax=gut metagenome TaxID=749906 RepID=J9FY78_9ZZZZ
MITRVAPPAPVELRLIWTPATFPLIELTKLTSWARSSSSASTCCTL